MDAEGLHVTVEYLSNSGVILSPEQKAALQISLPILRSDHKLKRVKLWGKVQGIKADYFIAHGVGEDELKDRKAVYRYFINYFKCNSFKKYIARTAFYGYCCHLQLMK